MSVVVTRSVRCHFNSPPQQGQRMLVTGTSTGSASAVAGGASRRWKGPCPGFRPGRLQWALRLPLENGVADRALCRRSFSSFFTSSRNRSFSVWTRVNSPRRDWFSSSKSSIRWQLSSGSGPVIQTTVTDPARNVQNFLARQATRKQLRPRLVGNTGNQVRIGRYWKKRRSTMKPTKTTTPLRDRCLSHCATLEYRLPPGSCRVRRWPVNYRKLTRDLAQDEEPFLRIGQLLRSIANCCQERANCLQRRAHLGSLGVHAGDCDGGCPGVSGLLADGIQQ